MTVEQLEAARAERMRQNGHGAITIEDVRTWIEETGLAIFLPRSAQAGFTAPTFVEAIAGQRTTEPTLELISTAESLLVRLEAEGVAVRLNLSGQPGDQPDYIVAGWVLPYIYALRGDRDWRRSPQLTGSRQVSQLAVQAAKHLDTANLNAPQLRDALGREVTETAVLRALHELWKQLRIIPVVPEVGVPALWQPLRQRFQKAIAEGASTSQVTAISVLASIYLQAVIAASMEDIEMFLSPLTSRGKIREVVRGLAATRQVHSTNMGPSPMFYVAGTLPEFPVAPSFQISNGYAGYQGSNYLGADPEPVYEEQFLDSSKDAFAPLESIAAYAADESSPKPSSKPSKIEIEAVAPPSRQAHTPRPAPRPTAKPAPRSNSGSQSAPKSFGSSKSSAPRPRAAAPAHPRDRARTGTAATSNGHSSNGHSSNGHSSNGHSSKPGSNGNGSFSKSSNGTAHSKGPAAKSFSNGKTSNGNGHASNGARIESRNGKPASSSKPSASSNGKAKFDARRPASSHLASGRPASSRPDPRKTQSATSASAKRNSAPIAKNSSTARSAASKPSRPTTASARPVANGKAKPHTAKSGRPEREPAKASATKRYSFSGQAKQAPKPAKRTVAVAAKPKAKTASKPVAKFATKSRTAVSSRSSSARSSSAHSGAKRRG